MSICPCCGHNPTRNQAITSLVLGGKKQTEVAKKYKLHPTRVGEIVRKWCLRQNEEVYAQLSRDVKHSHTFPDGDEFQWETTKPPTLKQLAANREAFL